MTGELFSAPPIDRIASNQTIGSVAYEVGDRIRHQRFGEGQVLAVSGDIIKIAFADHGIKQFAASIAPIEKI